LANNELLQAMKSEEKT